MRTVLRTAGILYVLGGAAFPQYAHAAPGPLERICEYGIAVVNHSPAPPAFKTRLLQAIEEIRNRGECWGSMDAPERDDFMVELLFRDALKMPGVLKDLQPSSISELAHAIRQGSFTRLQEIELDQGVVIQKDRVSGLALSRRISERFREACLQHQSEEDCRWVVPFLTREAFHGSIANWTARDLEAVGKNGTLGWWSVAAQETFKLAREVDPENPWLNQQSWCKRERTFWDFTPFGEGCEKDALRMRDLFDYERLKDLPARGGQ